MVCMMQSAERPLVHGADKVAFELTIFQTACIVEHWVVPSHHPTPTSNNLQFWSKTQLASADAAVPKTLRKVWSLIAAGGTQKRKRGNDDEGSDEDEDGNMGDEADEEHADDQKSKKVKKTPLGKKLPNGKDNKIDNGQKSIKSFFSRV